MNIRRQENSRVERERAGDFYSEFICFISRLFRPWFATIIHVYDWRVMKIAWISPVRRPSGDIHALTFAYGHRFVRVPPGQTRYLSETHRKFSGTWIARLSTVTKLRR